jgi:hypothetical protein
MVGPCIACSCTFTREDRKGREADDFEDLDVDGIVILNSFVKETRWRMWTEFIWSTIGTVSGLREHDNETSV